MTDARELVLEQALRTVFGAPLPDAAPRVLERWRAGSESPARRPARRALAAALALAACATLAFLLSRRGAGGRDALADAPLTASAPGAWRPTETTRPQPGDTLAAREAIGLTLIGGTRLELAPWSVVRIEPAGAVRLLAGDATLASAGGGELLVGAARAALAAGACVRARTLGFDDPHEFPPASLPTLAEDLHMRRIAPAAAAVFTLLSGSAVLTDAAGARELRPSAPVRSSAPEDGDDPVRQLLAREVGTWDLVITDYVDGKPLPTRAGTEVCTLPSTGEWLLTDVTVQRAGKPPVWEHVVLGYMPGTRTWQGSVVDSFGGRMGRVSGEQGDEPTVRVLHEGFEGEPPYGRTTTRWVGDDERHTTFEAAEGSGWVRTREIVHRRRR